MTSSNWFVEREASIDDSCPVGLSATIRNVLRRVLEVLFCSLAAANFWSGSLPLVRKLKGEEKHSRRATEKLKFLNTYRKEYGFDGELISIDELRSKEFARLEGTVYLDHAGATLYTETQLKATMSDLSTNLYGNPHSQSESSTVSSNAVEFARNQVLALCNASPEEYCCVFTSGATSALKLVGETFPWSSSSHYMYTTENHNSVLGIREYALDEGASVTPVDVDYDRVQRSKTGEASNFQFRHRSTQRRYPSGDQDCSGEVYNLFAFPLECNFSGAKFDLGLVPFVHKSRHIDKKRGQWLVLLDAAKGCSSAPPDLSSFPADFVALSFYKIFGYPTGLGALLVRKDAAKLMKKRYFGGGTVAVSIADVDFMQRRQRVEHWLEDGTVSFLSIASLRHGFNVITQLQMSAINEHTGCLANYTASKLADLKHGNNRRVCVLYGNHARFGRNDDRVRYWGPQCNQGPIVSFNMRRADRTWIGPREVEKLATLSGIHLRTGCFCNPGACAKYLRLTSNQMKANFEVENSLIRVF